MCGRYAVYSSEETIAAMFDIRQDFTLLRSYNVAPTENVTVVTSAQDKREINTMRWGLIPNWQKSLKSSAPLINPRIETIASKPSFSDSLRLRRCLIIADGFYEWRNLGPNQKQPYFIHRSDNKLFGIAGIWDAWGETKSCCIITLDADERLSNLHERMPAIIDPNNYDEWLSTMNRDWQKLKPIITKEPHESLVFHEVSSKVNSARYKNEDCILPRSLD